MSESAHRECCVHEYIKYHGFFADWQRLIAMAFESICRELPLVLNYTTPFYPYKNEPHANLSDEYFDIIPTVTPEQRRRLLEFFPAGTNITESVSPELLKKYGVQLYNFTLNNFVLKHDYDVKFSSRHYDELPPTDDYYIKKKYYVFKHLIWNYKFRLNPTIAREVDEYRERNMKNCVVIGIHFRYNCAKVCEQFGRGFKRSEDAFHVIDEFVKKKHIDNYKIYLVSDTKQVLDEFRRKYGERLLFNRNNIWLSDNQGSIEPHVRWLPDVRPASGQTVSPPGLAGGRELLKDVLILAKCNWFVKSPSNLSNWVLIINPDIDEI